VAIGVACQFQYQFYGSQHHDGRGLCPRLFARLERAEQRVVGVGRLVAMGHHEPPRLFVAGRWRPSCGFKQLPQIVDGHRPIGIKCSWTPAFTNQVDNVMVGLRVFGMRHGHGVCII